MSDRRSTNVGRGGVSSAVPDRSQAPAGEGFGRSVLGLPVRVDGYLLLATASVALLSASYLVVLYDVVNVVGGVGPFLAIVAGTVLLAGVLRILPVRRAIVFGAFLLGVGLVVYLLTMPPSRLAQLSAARIVGDTIALLTGYSVMQMTNVETWALAVTGAPTFLTWYFVFRREFPRAVAVGALTLSFFVLTGDSGTVGTMVGVLGATGGVGFHTLSVHGGSRTQGEVIAGIFAVMLVGAGTVTAVPGGGSPLVPSGTIDTTGDLVSADSRIGIGGSLDLSPTVLFTVESETATNWRVAAYDRYTGAQWIRTGPGSGVPGQRPGHTDDLTQRFTAHETLTVYPAAPTPTRVSGIDAEVTEFGDLRATGSLEPGDAYSVTSERPNATRSDVRRAGTSYPSAIETQYLQVPERTPDRVAELAAEVTQNHRTPYGKAAAIESWLEHSKGYTLDVRNPDGQLVDEFLFEMEAGYCVYFASSMVVMLRTQGIPARYVTGYTPGQPVGNDTYVVRGLDSHAWVEVYVPDVGWVEFDPTPAGPRRAAERERIQSARENDASGVDVLGSEETDLTRETTTAAGSGTDTSPTGSFTPSQPGVDEVDDFLNASMNRTVSGVDRVNASLPEVEASEGESSNVPPPGTIGLWGVVGLGLLAGVRRTRLLRGVYRWLWLRWLPRGEPTAVVDGAHERVQFVLERTYRTQRAGETAREYAAAVTDDERVHILVGLRERATYGGRADDQTAQRARELARAVLSDHGAAFRFSPSTVFNRLLS